MSDEDIKVKLEEMIEFFTDMGIVSQTERTKMLEEIEELNEIKQQICKEELITQDYVQENFIKKDKIKAKIKEIDKEELLQKIDFGQISLAIKVLYELLEEK